MNKAWYSTYASAAICVVHVYAWTSHVYVVNSNHCLSWHGREQEEEMGMDGKENDLPSFPVA